MSALAEAAKKLSFKQQRALEVLLVGGSDQQAAETAGLHRNTVFKLRTSDAGFIAAVAAARSDLLRRTAARLHAATTVAVKALEEVAKDVRYPAARVTAAKAIIEFSHKQMELHDVDQRLAALETHLAEQTGAAR